ncbi:MAG: DUF1731 domain-containing protein [Planctomycetota bacterium]|nr:DUF1731 domain-containing protein [Planctomycetota bacterium]
MVTPFRWGLGAWFGSGKQWTPWVHVDDVAGLVVSALKNEQLSGPVNVTAPEPVAQKRFAKALAGGFGMPALLPFPTFALEMFAGEQAQLMTASQRVICEKARQVGYEFSFENVESACEDIAKKMKKARQ